MEYKVLYSELQPCVLIACNCSPAEPFLLLIRGIHQVVTCGFCSSRYRIEVASYDARLIDGSTPPELNIHVEKIEAREESVAAPKPS
jgi:hypothetical protein